MGWYEELGYADELDARLAAPRIHKEDSDTNTVTEPNEHAY